MSEELKIGCARPTGGPVGEAIERKDNSKTWTRTCWKSMRGLEN